MANPFDDSEDFKVSNNPFDDEGDSANRFGIPVPVGRGGAIRTAAPMTETGRNPFADDDFTAANGQTTMLTSTSQSDRVGAAEPDEGGDPYYSVIDSAPLLHGEAMDPDAAAGGTTHTPTAPAEASWQYLGDLPYRRVPIYSGVRWERNIAINTPTAGSPSSTHATSLLQAQQSHGLSIIPPSVLQHHPAMLDTREVRALLKTSTITKVAGCPNGGPIAIMTLPIGGIATGPWKTTELRILTNAGKLIATLELPPSGSTQSMLNLPAGGFASSSDSAVSAAGNTATGSTAAGSAASKATGALAATGSAGTSTSASPFAATTTNHLLGHPVDFFAQYTPADILEMGFTSRTTLVVVFRDSLCLTYSLRGEPLLQPFFIMPASGTGGSTSLASASGVADLSLKKGTDLILASVYEGGVAILAKNRNAALVELLDDHDDPEYLQTAHVTAFTVAPSHPSSLTFMAAAAQADRVLPPFYGLVTFFSTAEYATTRHCSYLALAVLSRARTVHRHPEIFLSTTDHSVVVADAATTAVTDLNCRARVPSPIVKMSFAPNGRFLACFTESSMLTVISTSFETKVLDFDTSEGSSSPPLDMQWCGEDSVVLHWKNLGVLMVGPYGDWLRFPYEGMEHVFLIPEMDCCRVVTDSSVEILQRVPPGTAALLRIGSIETSAMLLDASDAFVSGSPASDEAARAIVKTGLLKDAIEACIDAATREYDIVTQKRLLKAASYGMHFSYKAAQDEDQIVLGGPTGEDPAMANDRTNVWPSSTALKFVHASRKLRILNALRNPGVGFVLTSAQYDAMTPTGVVARLIAMKRPAIASAIGKYLCLPKSVQLFARASKAAALVEADTARSDSETAEAAIRIINKSNDADQHGATSSSATSTAAAKMTMSAQSTITSIHRGCYATVALAANKAGRPGVANLLLLLESSVADKVPALLSTGSYADAMAVATTSRDADFIFTTLMEYERACMANVSNADLSKAQSVFLGTVVSKFTPEAFHTLRRYLQTTADVKSVTNLLLRAQRFTDAGSALAIRALAEDDFREKQGMLAESSRVFGLGKETGFHKQCTDEHLELLKDQEVLRTKYAATEVAPEGSSVTGTISAMIKFAAANAREQHRLLSDADKIAKKFRVSEKRLWHIKVKAFSESDQWSNLRILSDSRTKSPIGYKPFARATIKGKQSVTETLRYIDRMVLPEERYDLFCEAGLWKRALDEAGRLKDGRRILNVKTLCNSPEVQLLADQMLGRLA